MFYNVPRVKTVIMENKQLRILTELSQGFWSVTQAHNQLLILHGVMSLFHVRWKSKEDDNAGTDTIIARDRDHCENMFWKSSFNTPERCEIVEIINGS